MMRTQMIGIIVSLLILLAALAVRKFTFVSGWGALLIVSAAVLIGWALGASNFLRGKR